MDIHSEEGRRLIQRMSPVDASGSGSGPETLGTGSTRTVIKLDNCPFCGSDMRIEQFGGRLRVRFGGETIADSARAVLFREAERPPAVYFPPDDVRQELLQPTDTRTLCQYKGNASYWSIHAGGQVARNAVWSYQESSADSASIRGYLAFYWDRVDEWLHNEQPIEDRLLSIYDNGIKEEEELVQ
ncbi:DUF427 domain-containing protein [Paenibacillus radicis (ex Gao et al. 2016)]|uniref:DUF427 domain-containing protein n=1 Tax=Paenibacillus radicis (ex Gao et al. 2016) TaxID=1737354 RepID=A0A917M7T4_9BACL|nr:DUF427 domain-containing protein [Paenibacillus radicis (ex Gao et al. 2016)]GGG83016.1 hypothetical protein GCM10010918_45720 [Paenibacillus radicis (ex Gao et al. 2016)]